MELPGNTHAEMRRFHRKHGVTELMMRLNTHEVPEYYVKPVSERRIVEADEDLEQIPCINLQAPMSEDLLTAVARACTEWGFFYLINHGVPVSHLQDMQRCTREFFSLPHQEKLKINTPAGNAGPVHFGGGGNRDWREVLRIHFAPISESDKDYWPSKPVGFRSLLEEHENHLQRLSVNILSIISLSLGLNEDFLIEACGEAKSSITVNHAPPSLDPSLTMGHRTHSDPNMLTIILQDDVGGLQVQKGNRWFNVRPMENSFVVNIGDQVQILSNAKYKSCLHRVVNNNHSPRTSTAFFIAPSRNTTIGPAPVLVDENESPVYPNMVYGDYLDDFYEQAHCPDSSYPELRETEN